MFNYELQVSLLKSLSATYVDDKRVEITSKDVNASQNDFIANITYLKKEKLIDLSSLSTRSAITNEETGTSSDAYAIARATITHAGIKTLADLASEKLVKNTY
ncbi:MAG: hypothetical protein PHC75_09220 [Burkholderiales bacterium]|nr:hypothetical protein [Burkholderiales bacterium]